MEDEKKNKHGMAKFFKGLIKRLFVLMVVIALLGGTFYVYCSFFAPKPEDTVEKLLGAMEDYDIAGMLECLDPTVEKQYGALLNITGGLLGTFGGIDINLSDMMSLTPFLMEMDGDYSETKLDVEDIRVILYADCSGEELQEMLDSMSKAEIQGLSGQYISDVAFMNALSKNGLWFPAAGNLVANSCIVRTLLEGESEYEYLVLEKFDESGWRIYMPLY